jgi:putative hydrolase of the HAD superfamily
MPLPRGFKTGASLATIDFTGIRAIFFDAVGTLLHPAESVAVTYRAAARRQGVLIDVDTIRQRLRESFRRQEEIDRAADWRTSEPRELDRWRQIVRETLREVPQPDESLFELWEWFRRPEAWRTDPETANVVRELCSRGLLLGMASNFDARLAEIVAAKPELEPLAERLVISSLAGWRKPASEFFAELIAIAGHDANAILHVGDDPRNDVEGARSAGLRALLYAPNLKCQLVESIEKLSQLL